MLFQRGIPLCFLRGFRSAPCQGGTLPRKAGHEGRFSRIPACWLMSCAAQRAPQGFPAPTGQMPGGTEPFFAHCYSRPAECAGYRRTFVSLFHILRGLMREKGIISARSLIFLAGEARSTTGCRAPCRRLHRAVAQDWLPGRPHPWQRPGALYEAKRSAPHRKARAGRAKPFIRPCPLSAPRPAGRLLRFVREKRPAPGGAKKQPPARFHSGQAVLSVIAFFSELCGR